MSSAKIQKQRPTRTDVEKTILEFCLDIRTIVTTHDFLFEIAPLEREYRLPRSRLTASSSRSHCGISSLLSQSRRYPYVADQRTWADDHCSRPMLGWNTASRRGSNEQFTPRVVPIRIRLSHDRRELQLSVRGNRVKVQGRDSQTR
jgi:hypothetical protein